MTEPIAAQITTEPTAGTTGAAQSDGIPATALEPQPGAAQATQAPPAVTGEGVVGQKPEEVKTVEPSLLGAPDLYSEFTLDAGISADQEMMTQFGKLAKDLNLSQAGAQKLIDIQNGITKKMAGEYEKAYSERQRVQTAAALDSEYKELQSDAEIGGARLNETLGMAGYAFDALGCGDAREVLLERNLGNNRAIINMLAKVGKVLKEDGFVAGESGNTRKSDAQALYPDWK